MATIPVVVEPEKPTHSQNRTLSGSGSAVGRQIEQLDVDQLNQSITELSGKIGQLFKDIKAVGDYKLQEVEVQLEISASGGVSLIGNIQAGAKGAISLKFAPSE